MSQLVKSKSQMGGTLVSAFYERSEEDNDNGEILSIAHAVEVTPEYQPLKPYSKEFRNRVDDISKRRQFKDEAFNGKNTIEDMYSNIVASSSNLAIVAITKDFHKLDLGGLAVTIYRLITDRKFIRQVKEEFIFGSYKDMIMNDYI